MRSRSRKVLQKPENGGKHCASLIQKQGCEGFKCKSFHERKALSGEFSMFSVSIEIPISDTCCSLINKSDMFLFCSNRDSYVIAIRVLEKSSTQRYIRHQTKLKITLRRLVQAQSRPRVSFCLNFE